MSNVTTSKDPIGRQIVFTAKAVREAFEETLHRAGGSLGTWFVLSALSDEGVISQSALGGHVHLEGATITHHIDRLEQLGLVSRRSDPKDRRVRNLELTPAGAQLHATLLSAMREFERTLLDGLSERQLAELRTTLNRISENLS
jgi:MarR family transcriptional regulator, transcriptional regulator for hemolysin